VVQRARVAIDLIDSGSGPAMSQAVKDSLTVNPNQFAPPGMPQGPEGAPQ
jgi:hypothetical protein